MNFTYFFPKTLITEHFWMTGSADLFVPTKVLSHFYDHTFFRLSFLFFSFIIDIVGKGIQVPPFKGTHLLNQLALLFTIFGYPRLFSVPAAFEVLWTVSPTLREAPPVLI